MKIIVLGAGIIGVTTAYFLAEKGHEVEVIEKSAAAATDGASFGNGAQLSYSKTYPLSNFGTLAKLPKLLFSSDTPIHFHTLEPRFLRWGIHFLQECFNTEENAKEVLEIALKSRELVHSLVQRHEINFDYLRAGKMFVFADNKDFDHAAKSAHDIKKHGIEHKVINPDEAVKIEPALHTLKRSMVGAIYSPIDESGDAKKFADEMVRITTEMGVKYHFGHEILELKESSVKVESVITNKSEFKADKFVVCTGVETVLLLKKLGIYLPIYPMKGYSITAKATENAPKVSITDEARRIVYSTIGDRLRVAGVAEFGGFNKKINRKIVDGIIDAAKASFPDAADYSVITEWAGLRPMTASTVPIIARENKFGNLYYNTGHGMLGWTLACGSAQKLANLIS